MRKHRRTVTFVPLWERQTDCIMTFLIFHPKGSFMDRNRFLSVVLLFLLTLCSLPLTAQSNQESLADAARRIRAEKAAAAGKTTVPQPVVPKSQPASAQPAPNAGELWQDLFDRGDQALQDAEYVTAEGLFRKAIACAEDNHLDIATVASSYHFLAASLRAQRKYGDAETAFRTALQNWSKAPTATDAEVARSKAGLGMTLVGLSRYGEAEQLLVESLNTYHQHPEATTCEQSIPLYGLAMLYRSNHEYSKGEQLYTEAFALLAGNRGTPCETFVLLLDSLAGLYADDNQWEKVEKVQQGAISLALNMKGRRSEVYGDALFGLAQTLDKRRRFDEAASTYARAAEVFRQTDPPALSKLVQSLQLQEVTLYQAGKADEAKKVHAAVLAASEANNAQSENGEMMSLRTLLDEARRNGNIDEAARLAAWEVAASKKLSTFYQIVALNDSASVHEQQHNPVEAEAELKQALELSIASTGESSKSTADVHAFLARFYLRQNRLPEAEQSFAAALALLQGRDAEEIKQNYLLLSWAYVKAGKFGKAEEVCQRLLKIAEGNHDDASLSLVLQNLGIVYQKTNRLAEAEATFLRAMNIAAQLPPPMNRLWFPAAMSTATFYDQSGNALQAEQLYLQVITSIEKQYGENVPTLRLPLEKLIALLKSRGQTAEAAKYQARADKLPPMPAMPGMQR